MTTSIPPTLRVPFVGVQFDGSQAQQGPALLVYRAILFVQKLSTGAAAPDTFVRATGVADAIAACGRGSQAHRAGIGWFASNKTTELWLGVLADPTSGAIASGTIVVGGTATAGGTIPLYAGGVLVAVGVNVGDAAAIIAGNIASAINGNPDLPVTASATAATVTITFRHKGALGNGYDVRNCFNAGEALPAGVTLTSTVLAGGTGAPSLTNLISAMDPLWFQIWSHPYTDATSLTAIEGELASRLGPMRSIDGLAITSASGTLSALATLGASRNSPSSVIVAQPGANPLTPSWEFAAEVAALVAREGAIDPARPFQTLALSNAMPVAELDQFNPAERDLLLHDGIATTKLAAGGVVQLERIITTYQTNPSGQPDATYLDATTMLTLQYLRYAFRVLFANKYPRHKLADDGTRFEPGQPVMTPSLARAEALTWFGDMEGLGLVEDADQFKRDLVVVRSKTDPSRLEFLIPPNLVNGLVVVAADLQFRL